MDPEQTLRTLGGVAPMHHLVKVTSRRRVRAALRDGLIERAGRKLVLPNTTAHHRTAIGLEGVLSHLSAAQHWQWPVKWPPEQAWVTVKRKRHLDAARRGKINVVYADLEPEEIVDGVTSPLRTVLDCAKRLPFDEALAVADSALRSGLLSTEVLVAGAARVRGRGAMSCREVACAASPQAANPFESVLRAIVLEFPEFQVEPQGRVEVRGLELHPDLVDRENRIVFEADSHEFHTAKHDHDRDCERFTALGVGGWLVIRFSWEQVLLRPDYVRAVLSELAGIVRQRSLRQA